MVACNEINEGESEVGEVGEVEETSGWVSCTGEGVVGIENTDGRLAFGLNFSKKVADIRHEPLDIPCSSIPGGGIDGGGGWSGFSTMVCRCECDAGAEGGGEEKEGREVAAVEENMLGFISRWTEVFRRALLVLVGDGEGRLSAAGPPRGGGGKAEGCGAIMVRGSMDGGGAMDGGGGAMGGGGRSSYSSLVEPVVVVRR
jgi:hypothetical protein